MGRIRILRKSMSITMTTRSTSISAQLLLVWLPCLEFAWRICSSAAPYRKDNVSGPIRMGHRFDQYGVRKELPNPDCPSDSSRRP